MHLTIVLLPILLINVQLLAQADLTWPSVIGSLFLTVSGALWPRIDGTHHNRLAIFGSFALLAATTGLYMSAQFGWSLLGNLVIFIILFSLIRYGLYASAVYLLSPDGACHSLAIWVLSTQIVWLILLNWFFTEPTWILTWLTICWAYGYAISLFIPMIQHRNIKFLDHLKLFEFQRWPLYLVIYLIIALLYWLFATFTGSLSDIQTVSHLLT